MEPPQTDSDTKIKMSQQEYTHRLQVMMAERQIRDEELRARMNLRIHGVQTQTRRVEDDVRAGRNTSLALLMHAMM